MRAGLTVPVSMILLPMIMFISYKKIKAFIFGH